MQRAPPRCPNYPKKPINSRVEYVAAEQSRKLPRDYVRNFHILPVDFCA